MQDYPAASSKTLEILREFDPDTQHATKNDVSTYDKVLHSLVALP